MKKKVLILGVNGFIGSSLAEANPASHRLGGLRPGRGRPQAGRLPRQPALQIRRGDVMISHEWIEYHVKKCDVVIPLVAIANPAQYVKDPLRVFELDFESNLAVVRQCAKYRKRIIFPRPPRSTACARTRCWMRTPARWFTARPQTALDLRLLETTA